MTKTEKAIKWMEDTANDDSHGYDQIYRWGERGDYDCSSAVITAWENAGVPVQDSGAGYTGNMYPVFIKLGFKDVTKSVDLKTGKGLIRGDVLLNVEHHTAMYCGNGKEVEASINEKGTATGGLPGDQTTLEFKIRSYRNYPWDYVLRYDENINTDPVEISDDYFITTGNVILALEVINGLWGNGDDRKWSLTEAGYNYQDVQNIVNMLVSGYDAYAVMAHEVADGKWGNGDDRIERVTKAGYNAKLVQALVNCMLIYNLDI